MDKKKVEIINRFIMEYTNDKIVNFLDQALTEVWNTAIDEAEKAVGEDEPILPGDIEIGTDTAISWANECREEIRNNLRKLKV